MTAQFESTNQLQELLGILVRRKWQILVPALYVLSLGIALAAFLPRVYRARAQVNVFETRVEDAAFLGDPLAGSGGREIQNAKYQVMQDNRIRKVLDDLQWPDYLQLTETEKLAYRDKLRDRLSIEVLPKAKNEGSTFIDLTFDAGDPRRAEDFLQQLAVLWLQDVYQRDEQNRTKEREVLQDQRRELQEELRRLTIEFGDKLKASGFSIDQLGNNQRFSPPPDPLFQRISETEVKLATAERNLEGRRAALAVLEAEWERTPITLAEPTEIGSTTYDNQVAELQAKIALQRKRQTGLKHAHSRYQQAELEVRLLEEEIESLRGRERRGEITLKPTPNPQRERLALDVASAEADVASLEEEVKFLSGLLERDQARQRERIDLRLQLEELKSTIDLKQTSLDEIERKYLLQEQALEILRRATQLYEITREARAKDEPISPIVTAIWLFSLLGGLGLGLAVAGIAEFTQPGFRTPVDLARTLSVPVLGVIQRVPTRLERRELLQRRALVLFSTVLLLGGLHWFVWTWSQHPERLGTSVVRALEDAREQLR